MKNTEKPNADDEALLVLYVANELDANTRMQFDLKLASSQELRTALNELRSAHELIASEIGSAPGASDRPAASQASQRQLSRVFRQWQVDRMRRAARMPEEARRSRWWMYPAAAAVAVIFWIGWWGMQAGVPEHASSTRPVEDPPATMVADPTVPVDPLPQPPMMNPAPYPTYPSDLSPESPEMASAERELERLEMLRTLSQLN